MLRTAAPGSSSLLSELLALLAFDLAYLGALPRPVTIRALPEKIVSLVARVELVLPPGATTASFDNGKLTVERAGSPLVFDLAGLARGETLPGARRPYHAIGEGIVLSLADNNPLAFIETHPEKKAANTVDLGGHPAAEWIAMLEGALELVGTHLPAMRADIDVLLQQIVPTGFDPERHLSCSYQEAIGSIYVSLHPSPMTMAEALIHEVSHNKLNALFDLDPVLENLHGELYASPVRPDPRPLHGVLLAVHAFLPVARLYERMLEDGAPLAAHPSFRARFDAIVRGNHEGTKVVLDRSRPTVVGRALLDEFARWDAHFGTRPVAP